MRAKPKLIKLFDQYGLQPWMLSISSEKEIIILKDNDKKFLPYKDTDFTKDAREQLQHINRHLEATVIDLNLNEEQMRGLLRRMRKSDDGDFDDQGKHLSFFTQKTLYRIFSNSSWKQHGRFYGGWWMQLPEREKVKENGKVDDQSVALQR